MARIRAALRRSAPLDQAEYFPFGDLTVYPRVLLAKRGEETIELTPRETSILRFLVEQRGEAVSRDALFDRCWGIDYFPDSRTLDQHILLLRKKVEPDPANPMFIQTVRSIGYRYS